MTILRADLESAEFLDDLEEITAVEAAIIQEVDVDEEWDPEGVTMVMPEGQRVLLQEKCR